MRRGSSSRARRIGLLVVLLTGGCGESGPESTTGDDAGAVNYAQHVAPILEARCGACHDDGGIGGFSLLSYDAARTWANFATELMETRQMPPFPPSGRSEASRLTQARSLLNGRASANLVLMKGFPSFRRYCT